MICRVIGTLLPVSMSRRSIPPMYVSYRSARRTNSSIVSLSIRRMPVPPVRYTMADCSGLIGSGSGTVSPLAVSKYACISSPSDVLPGGSTAGARATDPGPPSRSRSTPMQFPANPGLLPADLLVMLVQRVAHHVEALADHPGFLREVPVVLRVLAPVRGPGQLVEQVLLVALAHHVDAPVAAAAVAAQLLGCRTGDVGPAVPGGPVALPPPDPAAVPSPLPGGRT